MPKSSYSSSTSSLDLSSLAIVGLHGLTLKAIVPYHLLYIHQTFHLAMLPYVFTVFNRCQEADVFPRYLQHKPAPVPPSLSPNESYNSSPPSLQSPSFPSSDRSLHDFDILKLLGTGGIGRVYLARDKRTSKFVAVKIISKKNRDKSQLDDVANEQLVHHSVSDCADKFVLPLLGSWHDNLNFFIVTVCLITSSNAHQQLGVLPLF